MNRVLGILVTFISIQAQAQDLCPRYRCIAVTTVSRAQRLSLRPGYGYGDRQQEAQDASVRDCQKRAEGLSNNGCAVYKCAPYHGSTEASCQDQWGSTDE